MKFTPLAPPGAYLLEREVFHDERGSFARQFCQKEKKEHGIDFTMCQCNLSTNHHKGTLRGIHNQKMPYIPFPLHSPSSGARLSKSAGRQYRILPVRGIFKPQVYDDVRCHKPQLNIVWPITQNIIIN